MPHFKHAKRPGANYKLILVKIKRSWETKNEQGIKSLALNALSNFTLSENNFDVTSRYLY